MPRRVYERSLLLSMVCLVVALSLASAGSGRAMERTAVGGTPFETIGFAWMRAQVGSEFYYTVFNDPRVLPLTAEYPPLSLPEGAAFYQAGEFLDGSSYMIDVLSNLHEVEAASGQVVSIVAATPPPTGETYTGMAIDPTTGVMYACSSNFSGSSTLMTIDVATGDAKVLGTVTNAPALQAIAIDGEGSLWGFGSTNDSLLSINKRDATAVTVGELGYDVHEFGGAGMAWDPIHDVLWAVAFRLDLLRSDLLAVDRESGSTDQSGELGVDFPGGRNLLGWLGLATPEYFDIFADGFESGDTTAWSNTVP